jgi:hypothetical protein
MEEITDSLERALDRIDEFRALHDGAPLEQGIEAVNCLQEAVGIGEEARTLIRERIFEGDESVTRPPEMLLGVIVGLLAAQFQADGRPTEAAPG